MTHPKTDRQRGAAASQGLMGDEEGERQGPRRECQCREDLNFSSSPKDFSTNYLVESREMLESHLGAGENLLIGNWRREERMAD